MTSSCLQDAEQVLLGQIASPDAAASVVVAVTSGLGLAPALQASLGLTAVQVIQKALHLFVIQSKKFLSTLLHSYCFWAVAHFIMVVLLENCAQPQLRQHIRPIKGYSSSSFCNCIDTFVWVKTWLFPQVVWVDSTGRTVLSCAPVEREASATRQLGSVSVPLVGWDRPANKVMLEWCLWLWAPAGHN